MKTKKYIIQIAASALVLIACIGAFNYVVDPYAMFRPISDADGKLLRPAALNQIRLHKAYAVQEIAPDSIALGSSRTFYGIDPENPTWTAKFDSTYNLGFEGATAKEMYYYLRHAASVSDIKHVMFGVDMFNLVPGASSTKPDFDPQILAVGNGPRDFVSKSAATIRLLTSITTTMASFDQAFSPSSPLPPTVSARGQRLSEALFNYYAGLYKDCGPACYFNSNMREQVQYALEWHTKGKVRFVVAQPPKSTDSISRLEYIEKIIEFCADKGIALDLFITPTHVQQAVMRKLIGSLENDANGKRFLVDAVAKYEGDIRLFDFNLVSRITTEDIPEADDLPIQNYWDSSHFKSHVGDLIMDAMLSDGKLARAEGLDWVLLAPENVDDVIAQQGLALAEFEQFRKDEVMSVKEKVDTYAQLHGINF